METPEYDHLISTILSEEDRKKFESFIGRIIMQGRDRNLVIEGDYGSGKSTLLHLARGVMKAHNDVVFCHDPRQLSHFPPSRYRFVANDIPKFQLENSIVIRTTGKTIPSDVYARTMTLTNQVYFNEISRRCVEQYNNSQEN
jgi:ABC-type cobalamin/Fe3+-siderophores transport system ATPase subunit